MRTTTWSSIFLLLGLALQQAIAAPFPARVANDSYSSVANGIPTARSNNDGVPDIYHAINQLTGSGFVENGQADFLFSEPDAVWSNLTGTVTLIGLTAGNSNTLGIYTGLGTGGGRTELIGPYSGFGFLGAGTFADPYPTATMSIAPSTPFGWYLRSQSGSGANLFFSEPALNAGDQGLDHMMTFDLARIAGLTLSVWIYDDGDRDGRLDPDEEASRRLYTFTNPALLAWEDLRLGSDGRLGDDDYDDMIYLVDAVPGTVPEPGTLLLLAGALAALRGARVTRAKRGWRAALRVRR